MIPYTPDQNDAVEEENHVPCPVPGAPLPTVMATEDRLLLSYYSKLPPPARLQKPILVGGQFSGTVSIVEFYSPASFFSLPLSNETLLAHPLAYRGLRSYGAFYVKGSSWIRELIAAQYVHPRPFPAAFENSKHYIFTFHDSIFEAVADGITLRTIIGSAYEAQDEMLQLLRAKRR